MDEEKLSIKELEALRYIRNWLVHHGQSPSVRKLAHALGYRSPRSAAVILEKLTQKKFLQQMENKKFKTLKKTRIASSHARTVDVPLVGTVACGAPILAEENIEAYYPVSTSVAKPPHKYFLLRASGDSMDDAGIEDGTVVLIRQQPSAENGDRIVALIDDGATIKEYFKSDDMVILKPRSNSEEHKPIILTGEFRIQGIVIKTIPEI